MTGFDRFVEVYTEELTRAVQARPADYFYKVADVPAVVARMAAAFKRGSYNKQGRAIAATCKRLGIPYTYDGINTFIKKETVE